HDASRSRRHVRAGCLGSSRIVGHAIAFAHDARPWLPSIMTLLHPPARGGRAPPAPQNPLISPCCGGRWTQASPAALPQGLDLDPTVLAHAKLPRRHGSRGRPLRQRLPPGQGALVVWAPPTWPSRGE